MGLTHYLALKAGFCPDMARAIGVMDASIDFVSDTTPIKEGAEYNFFKTDSSRESMRLHFPIDPNAAAGAVVVRNSSYANELVDTQISAGDPFEFARAIHVYQDSWSHEGYGLRGHGKDGVYPDKTWVDDRWIGRDMEMALWTYHKLVRFLEENPEFCQCQPPEPFPEKFVMDYLKAEKMRKKEDMLWNEGLTEYGSTNEKGKIILRMELKKYEYYIPVISEILKMLK